MGRLSITDIFGAQDPSQKPIAVRRNVPRAHFAITTPEPTEKILNWMIQFKKADQDIKKYLCRSFGLMSPDAPIYDTNEEGCITRICFQFGAPLTMPGWRGDGIHNWLYPETHEVQKDIQGLSRMLTRHELNEIVDWPEPCLDKLFRDIHIRGYKSFAKAACAQVMPYIDNNRLYICVPHAKAFQDYPPLMQEVEAWEQDPPEFLYRVEPPKFVALKKAKAMIEDTWQQLMPV